MRRRGCKEVGLSWKRGEEFEFEGGLGREQNPFMKKIKKTF